MILRAIGILVLALPALPAPAQSDAKPGASVISVPAGVQQRTVRFARFRTSLRDGDGLGEIRTGEGCGIPSRLMMNPRTEQAIMAPALRAVRDELTRAGYRDPARGSQRVFEDEEQQRPDLLLGGMLEDFNAAYCSSASGARTDGEVRIRVRWELYDTAERKVVHGRTIDAAYRTSGAEAMREGEFFGMAYRDSIRQLLADRKFYDAVVTLAAPAAAAQRPAASSDRKLVLKPTAPPKDALSVNMTLTRAAVVTITHPQGSGSGFFISDSGHVLTNSHVVGDNRFVRVILATGRELVGEVLQRDPARDVALIKTEGANYIALAIGSAELNVGAEVVAIGSPLGEALSGTVTRGIVSAYRTIRGKRYIQSDVALLPGNSGGPLLDRTGRVVGIAVMGLGGTAINFFVPIQEALGELGITLAGS